MHHSQQWQIAATVAATPTTLRLHHWALLAMGEGHIVLENSNSQDEHYWSVIIICMHDIHSTPLEFEDLYESLIQGSPIKQYLLHKDRIILAQQERQILKEFLNQSLKIGHNISDNYLVHLAPNLNRTCEAWDYSLQFKPKSALPDRYSSTFIENLSQKLGVQREEIASALRDSPWEERTRWFKKNAFKTVKKNMNPLEIFGVVPWKASNLVNSIRKIAESAPSLILTTAQEQALTFKILKALYQSNILSAIAKFQLMHTCPNDAIQSSFSDLWEKQQEKEAWFCKIRQQLQKELDSDKNAFDEISGLLQSPIIQEAQATQDDHHLLLSMFRFLVSWSWRDVSLVVRLKLSHPTLDIEAIDFKIIDYQLKECSKLKSTIQKDEKFLVNYLKYLKIL